MWFHKNSKNELQRREIKRTFFFSLINGTLCIKCLMAHFF